MKHLLLLCALAFLFSCNEKKSQPVNPITNTGNLRSQLFTININADTTLVTLAGTIIKIPNGALQSAVNPVKLEIKEALSINDIVLAGLSTMIGKQALSSGGMLYFNAASGYQVEIKKPIQISVPTGNYNRDMKVFKGEETNGSIKWTNPGPLPEDETTKKLDAGKNIFSANCSSCHKIAADFAGPALYGITEKRSRAWLQIFTRHNPASFIFGEGNNIRNNEYPRKPDSIAMDEVYTDTSRSVNVDDIAVYHACLKNRFHGTEMTGFPTLTNKDIDLIYTYIKNVSDNRPDLKDKYKENCCDSCIAYWKAKNSIMIQREKYITDNGRFFNLDREIPGVPSPPFPIDTTTPSAPIKNSKVSHINTRAVYYTINITATGWYNIDILMKDFSNCVPSELMVRIQGTYTVDFNVNLVIPSVKAFVEGGKLNNGTDYGFDEDDGRIPLPQGASCTVLAFATAGDTILFGKALFNAQTKQLIEINVKPISKEALKQEIKNMNFENVKPEVKDAIRANEIREIDKKLPEIEKLKPKNCDCNFLQQYPVAKK